MLLKDGVESLLRDEGVHVWAFGRDQAGHQRSVGTTLKERVLESAAVIILLSRFTLQSGATQWMELAYADAFGIPAFILLHHLTFEDLKRAEPGAPPLVQEGQCTLAVDWRSLENGLRACCVKVVPEPILSTRSRKGLGRKGEIR